MDTDLRASHLALKVCEGMIKIDASGNFMQKFCA